SSRSPATPRVAPSSTLTGSTTSRPATTPSLTTPARATSSPPPSSSPSPRGKIPCPPPPSPTPPPAAASPGAAPPRSSGARRSSRRWNGLLIKRFEKAGYMSGSRAYRWLCPQCGQMHDELPFSYAADAPAYWYALSPAERDERAVLGEEQCEIDE